LKRPSLGNVTAGELGSALDEDSSSLNAGDSRKGEDDGLHEHLGTTVGVEYNKRVS